MERPGCRGRPVALRDLGQGPFFPPKPSASSFRGVFGALGRAGRQGPPACSQASVSPPATQLESREHFRVRKRSGGGVGAIGAPRGLTWRWQSDGTTTDHQAALLLPPRRSPPVLALAQPPYTGQGRSRLRSPRAPAFRAGPGAPPPKPPKPSPGCWPRDGPCTSAPPYPQEAGHGRALQRVLARGSAGWRGVRADT